MCFRLPKKLGKKFRQRRRRSRSGSPSGRRSLSRSPSPMGPSINNATIRSRESTASPPARLADRRFLNTSLRPSLRSSIPNESDIELGSVRTNSARHSPAFHHADEHEFDAIRSRSASLDVATPSIEQQQARALASASSSSTMYQGNSQPQTPAPRDRVSSRPTVKMVEASVNTRRFPTNRTSEHPFANPSSAAPRVKIRENVEYIESSPSATPPPLNITKQRGPHGPRPNPETPASRDLSSFGSHQSVKQAGEDDQEAKKAKLAADRQGVLQRLADRGISHPSYAAYATGSNHSSPPPSPSSSSVYSATTATPRGSTSAVYRGASGSFSIRDDAGGHAGGSAGRQIDIHPGHSRNFSANAPAAAAKAHHGFLPATPLGSNAAPSWVRQVSASTTSAASHPSPPGPPPRSSPPAGIPDRSNRDFSYTTTPPRMAGASGPAPVSTHPGGYADRNPYRGGHGVIASNRNAPGGSASLIEAGEWFGNNGGLATPVRGRGSRCSGSGSGERAGSVGGRGGGGGGDARLHDAQIGNEEYDEYYGGGDGVANKDKGKGKEVMRY